MKTAGPYSKAWPKILLSTLVITVVVKLLDYASALAYGRPPASDVKIYVVIPFLLLIGLHLIWALRLRGPVVSSYDEDNF